ncbi:MAG: CDP-diacylglycerol--glycerol-3-phosphate 3-phosphatidyltransferase [Spirochaetaceae bacterium]|jgi:CDP-diacylglycerol--glycerol-3-phosphate 3-phosphatidyltransferase|nr:CDP-diacylglycerol--glycerol-3-phosphate 3-phosphatidyltransferase [Spirochaetaceae bacterium]
MTAADKVTSIRLYLAPVFFIVYLLPRFNLPPALEEVFFSRGQGWTVPVLWVLFVVSELTDMLDGAIARRSKMVSDFGKLFDPFADVLVRVTYFLCFVVDGILPAALLLLVLYREFAIQFVRNLMLKKGVVMGARWAGKVKSVVYMVAGALALLASSISRLGVEGILFPLFRGAAVAAFALSVILALASFGDYVSVYRKAEGPGHAP